MMSFDMSQGDIETHLESLSAAWPHDILKAVCEEFTQAHWGTRVEGAFCRELGYYRCEGSAIKVSSYFPETKQTCLWGIWMMNGVVSSRKFSQGGSIVVRK